MKKDRKILNVGCGNETYGTDFIDLYPSRSEVKKVFIGKERFPYKNDFFDEVYSNCVLEHLVDIGHFLKKIETKLGSITSLYDKGVILDNGQKLNTDVIVNCVGFEKNGANAKEICGYKETYNNNYVDKDFMYLADAYIDDEAFNSFFGSSVLEMVKFYMELFVKYFDNPSYYKMIEIDGINKLPLDDRRWSHYIKAATSLIQNDADLYQIAKKQVDNRTKNFLEKHDLKTYLAENKREWIDIHSMLTGKKMTEDQCLPYVFEKLRPK